MSEIKLLSRLIGDIYDAAFDPALWPDALEKSCWFVGSGGVGKYLRDAFNDTARMSYRAGSKPAQRPTCIDADVKLDLSPTSVMARGVEDVTAISDIIPFDELLEARFNRQQWMLPQGWLDIATSLLDKPDAGHLVPTFFPDERIDDPARRRMRMLVPHVRRAIFIGKILLFREAETATLADALDSVAAGLFLVAAQGRLARTNARGHALIADGTILRSAGGRLVASDPVADEALRDALVKAASGDAMPGKQGIAVPLGRSDGDWHVAHVLPVPSIARRKVAAGWEAAAAVLVRKASLEAPPKPEIIAKLYRLTPGELRVLLAMFESDGVPELAEALGISESTVRTHLSRLFEKTGTKRQADLVKLVAGFAWSPG